MAAPQAFGGGFSEIGVCHGRAFGVWVGVFAKKFFWGSGFRVTGCYLILINEFIIGKINYLFKNLYWTNWWNL